jgi:hypothetical protein
MYERRIGPSSIVLNGSVLWTTAGIGENLQKLTSTEIITLRGSELRCLYLSYEPLFCFYLSTPGSHIMRIHLQVRNSTSV